jgi:hypothetical protein
MKDAGDPIPVGMISIRDARDIVYRTNTPDWQSLEERLSDPSPDFDGPSGQANRKAWRNYDQALRHARECLCEKIIQGRLIPLVRDPKTGDILQLDREWAQSIGHTDIDVMTATAIIRGERQPVFFDRKSFDDVMKDMASPDGDSAAHPGESAPAASKRKSTQEEIREVSARLWPNGYSGRSDSRNDAIRQDFTDRGLHAPADRSIQRALSGK